MNNIKTSIAMATYNGGKYLQEQLDSFSLQTRLPDELIVCDDVSTDETFDILQKFSASAPFKVEVVQNECNLGFVKNFEKAIALCSGDIIFLSDQDDIWQPNRVEYSVGIFNKHPEYGYIFSDANFIDSKSQPLEGTLWEKVNFWSERQQNFAIHDTQASVLYESTCVTGATLAFRKMHCDLLFPLPPLDRIVHDGWIALLLSLQGSFGIAVPKQLISYRIHAQQQIGISHKQSFYQRLQLRFSGHTRNIEQRLSELLTIRTRVEAQGSTKALERFESTLGVLLTNLKFRYRILSIPGRHARIGPVFGHYVKGGYQCNLSPLLSAFKDLIY